MRNSGNSCNLIVAIPGRTQSTIMKKKILVVGSSNTDMVIKSSRLPLPGETIIGGNFFMNPGGKGANQAVAAARLNGEVIFLCKTGNDIFGKTAKQHLIDMGINVEHVIFDAEHPSGVALINVDEQGENSITVASGANGNLLPQEVEQVLNATAEQVKIVLLQLEIPLPSVIHAIRKSAALSKIIIVNPAPAHQLPDDIYPLIDYLTPNEQEAALLAGIPIKNISDVAKAADKLLEKGVRTVIVTLGENGSYIASRSLRKHIPARKVKAVDSTAAGDVFNGALATALAEDMPLEEAVNFAASAAAISVTRLGAQSSAPFRNEI